MRELTITDVDNDWTALIEAVERGGEAVIILREGRPVVTIAPAIRQKTATWESFIRRLAEIERPDPGFADDLEATQREQPSADIPGERRIPCVN